MVAVNSHTPPSPGAPARDTLAYIADMAVELSVLCASHGFDDLGAQFLDAAASARRLRAPSPPMLHAPPNAADPNAT